MHLRLTIRTTMRNQRKPQKRALQRWCQCLPVPRCYHLLCFAFSFLRSLLVVVAPGLSIPFTPDNHIRAINARIPFARDAIEHSFFARFVDSDADQFFLREIAA